MAEIDTLQVRITANAQAATASLKSLTTALQKVRTALTGVKDGVSITDHLATNLNQMNGALNTLSTGGIRKLQKLANAINDYSSALKNLKASGAGALANVKAVNKYLSDSGEYNSPITRDVNVGVLAPNVMEELDRRKRIAAWKSSVLTSDFTDEDFVGIDEPRPVTPVGKTQEKKVSALSRFFSRFKTLGKDAQEAGEETKKAGEEIDKAGKKANKAAGFFGKFIKSIGRIMLYRAIRSALKAIGEAFSEGLKNAYHYSEQSETFQRLAETLDHIKSITSQMVNQLGAFWGEVRQFLLPAIEWIVEAFRKLAEYATEFFAALNGEPTYLRAKLTAEKWDEATGNIKEYKHQLLALDELNVLSATKNGTTPKDKNYGDKYEEIATNQKLLDTLGKVKEFTLGISDILFDWTDLTGEDVCKKLITGLSGLAGAVVGFSIGGIPGAVVGSLVGIALGLGISSLLPLIWDVTGQDLGKIFATGIAGLAGAVVGFEIGGPIGALVGTITGVGISLAISKLLPVKAETEYGAKGLFDLLAPALGALVGGIIGWTLGETTKSGKLKGSFLGMAIGAEVGLTLNNILKATNGTVIDGQDLFDLLEVALDMLAGGFIGWTYGGTKGVFVGMALGAQVGLIMRKLDKAEFQKEYGASTLFKLLNPALKGLTGGWLGLKLAEKLGKSGSTGLFLGMNIGVSLALILRKFEEAKEKGIVKQAVVDSILAVLNGLVVAGMLFYLTGKNLKAASVGLSIGVSVTLWLQSLDWSSIAKSIYDKGKELKNSGSVAGQFLGTMLEEVSEDKVPKGYTGGEGTISSYMLDNKHGGVHGKFASGGIPAQGSLFYAGEAGAEFVGNMGSTAAVANAGQMTDAIYKAAYMGMSRALAENGGNGFAGFEPATTDDLFIAMRKKASNYNKMTGSSAFA